MPTLLIKNNTERIFVCEIESNEHPLNPPRRKIIKPGEIVRFRGLKVFEPITLKIYKERSNNAGLQVALKAAPSAITSAVATGAAITAAVLAPTDPTLASALSVPGLVMQAVGSFVEAAKGE
jgi:hypothetical protein